MAEYHDGDIVKAVCSMHVSTGDDVQNVFHWRYVGPSASDALVNDALLEYVDDMYGLIQAGMPADMTFWSIDITNVTQEIFYGAYDWPGQISGGGSGDTMPEQNCALVTASTIRSKTLGKKFLGPFIESNNADGVWAGGMVGSLASFAAAWLTDIAVDVAGALQPVVVHYVANQIVYYTDLLASHVTNAVYTQRRRRRGVGA